jgi:hypothetical protein
MKDFITVKFTIGADFDTIQEIRQAFAEELALDLLKRQTQGVVQTHLRAATTGLFSLETAVKVSSHRKTKKGPRLPIPQVKDGVLTWYDPDADRVNRVGKVGSKSWFQWLNEPVNTSFSYTSKYNTTFTAMKRQDGIWYAHKRLQGKLKRKYLGVAESVTAEKLDQVAFDLAQRDLP